MTHRHDIICISSIDWDYVWQGHQEVMRRFALAGNRVLFVENTGLRRPTWRDAPRLWRRLRHAGVPGSRRHAVPPGLRVLSPLVLADGINALSAGDASGALPLFLGLAGFWAALRFASTAGPQIRDAIFQPISEEAQRRAGARVFSHVHSLSVRFHQSKRTGSVYRTIERGVRATRDRLEMAVRVDPGHWPRHGTYDTDRMSTDLRAAT